MLYRRMRIEVESPEEMGYGRIRNNLSESSITDRTLGDFTVDLSGLLLPYGEHRGEPRLRELIAAQGSAASVTMADVLVTQGAAGALFIVATSLLDKDSHLVVVRPNYATNLETPRAIGCGMTCVDLSFDDAWQLDLAAVERAVHPTTRLISVTSPHNPTGTVLPWETLVALEQLAERQGCLLLVDETYRDLTYGDPPPTAASISPRVIAVSSLSKAFGTPGLRLGWLITRDPALMELFLAAKEQIGICGGIIDERLGVAVLEQRDAFLSRSRPHNRARRDIVRDWIAREPLMEWVEPQGGVVCFPRMRVATDFDTDRFYDSLLHAHGTYVGPGHWFEMSKRYMRIGFAWPTEQELRDGLAAISAALREQG